MSSENNSLKDATKLVGWSEIVTSGPEKDPQEQLALGRQYKESWPEFAKSCFRLAAIQGIEGALMEFLKLSISTQNLSTTHRSSIFKSSSAFYIPEVDSAKNYFDAAIKESAPAMLKLSHCYIEGLGVEKDEDIGFVLALEAVKNGAQITEKDFMNHITTASATGNHQAVALIKYLQSPQPQKLEHLPKTPIKTDDSPSLMNNPLQSTPLLLDEKRLHLQPGSSSGLELKSGTTLSTDSSLAKAPRNKRKPELELKQPKKRLQNQQPEISQASNPFMFLPAQTYRPIMPATDQLFFIKYSDYLLQTLNMPALNILAHDLTQNLSMTFEQALLNYAFSDDHFIFNLALDTNGLLGPTLNRIQTLFGQEKIDQFINLTQGNFTAIDLACSYGLQENANILKQYGGKTYDDLRSEPTKVQPPLRPL